MAKILHLLQQFGICIAVEGTDFEMIPSRLPIGTPDARVWPMIPGKDKRQITFKYTFPSVPITCFSGLMCRIMQTRRFEVLSFRLLMDVFEDEVTGCDTCGKTDTSPGKENSRVYHESISERN